MNLNLNSKIQGKNSDSLIEASSAHIDESKLNSHSARQSTNNPFDNQIVKKSLNELSAAGTCPEKEDFTR